MKKQFNLTESLKERRENVIAKYNSLTEERFFDGITLRNFMIEVMNMCQINRIASEKTLDRQLPYFMGEIYFNHSKVTAFDAVTANLKKQYQGTAFMAMV